ncbi:MAG: hypothetical protein RDV48_23555 [Candidatus Eremiobacteraeota bacterium]|nr:hypothetical protein [Candidatus Eremiobacteraeota bacterium]
MNMSMNLQNKFLLNSSIAGISQQQPQQHRKPLREAQSDRAFAELCDTQETAALFDDSAKALHHTGGNRGTREAYHEQAEALSRRYVSEESETGAEGAEIGGNAETPGESEETPYYGKLGKLFYDTTTLINAKFTRLLAGRPEGQALQQPPVKESILQKLQLDNLKKMIDIDLAQYNKGALPYSKVQLAMLSSELGPWQNPIAKKTRNEDVHSIWEREENEKESSEMPVDRFSMGLLANALSLFEKPAHRMQLNMVA